MRISMWSSYLIEMSPEKMVETMLAHGWDNTELSDEHAKVLLERGKASKVGKDFKDFCDGHGFFLPQGHFYLSLNIAHPDEGERARLLEEFKCWCELFNVLGIQAGVLHPGGGGWPADTEPERIKDVIRRSLGVIKSYVENGPTSVCLENMRSKNGEPGKDATELLELIEPVGFDNFGLCLDTGHLMLAHGDCASFIRQAGPALKALHIADNMGVEDDHILPYSGGKVPWQEVLAALRELKYQGLFNFEVPGERCPQPISLDKLDYARKLGQWMTRDL
jgi:sugar phosphate isomerase/epimerase